MNSATPFDEAWRIFILVESLPSPGLFHGGLRGKMKYEPDAVLPYTVHSDPMQYQGSRWPAL